MIIEFIFLKEEEEENDKEKEEAVKVASYMNLNCFLK